jgi:hypothetical protein
MAMDTTETFMIYQDVNRSASDGSPRFGSAMLEDALFYSFGFTIVANPRVLPASVRRILAHSNYKGNITFLLYKQTKFPREAIGTTLHYLMYKWIIEGALYPSTGISHVIRPLIEKHFEMPWLDPNFTSEDMEKFRPRGMNYYTVRELESRDTTNDSQLLNRCATPGHRTAQRPTDGLRSDAHCARGTDVHDLPN